MPDACACAGLGAPFWAMTCVSCGSEGKRTRGAFSRPLAVQERRDTGFPPFPPCWQAWRESAWWLGLTGRKTEVSQATPPDPADQNPSSFSAVSAAGSEAGGKGGEGGIGAPELITRQAVRSLCGTFSSIKPPTMRFMLRLR